jgi:tRNA pseudouridine synthase 10
MEWRRTGPRTLELTVRAQAGTYIKELVSGDGGRTTPSVAEILGTAAQSVELDVVGIHLDAP